MSNPHPTTTELVNQFSREPNYSDSNSDDFEALSRDRIPVRSMAEGDLEQMVRIDRHITGRDRRTYYDRKVKEALQESGIRVSVVAEVDDHVVGFIMARVDYGEYGQTVPAAIIDTIAVDPDYRGKDVGRALVSQLLTNLNSLRVDVVRTEVEWNNFGLNRFLDRCGFQPAQRLSFSKRI